MDKNPHFKLGIDMIIIALCLRLSIPTAVSIFDPVSKIEVKKCEPEFQKFEYLYFDNGL